MDFGYPILRQPYKNVFEGSWSVLWTCSCLKCLLPLLYSHCVGEMAKVELGRLAAFQDFPAKEGTYTGGKPLGLYDQNIAQFPWANIGHAFVLAATA